jgi:hypothetical protein
MEITKTILMFLLFFIIAGCQSTPQPIKIPKWVAQPPQDTKEVFYGIGSGYNIDTANSAALKSIASKLGVTVQGLYLQRQQMSDQAFQNYVDDQVQLSVEETPISNYQIVKSEAINQTIYSLITVSKSQLLMNAEEKLARVNKVAVNLIRNQKSQNRLVWSLEAKKALIEKVGSAYRYAAIINLLSPVQSIDSNLSVWSSLIEKELESRKELCISFKNVNNSSTDIINIIKNSLSKQSVDVSAVCINTLRVKSKEEQKIIYKKNISSIEIDIEFIDENKKLLASQSFIFAGQSISSFVNARKGALGQFEKKLTTQTIWELLDITKKKKEAI